MPTTLGEILSALSYALDITEGARPGHSVRSCLLGMRLARQIGLASEAQADLYYALLLKDIGCSSNSARMAEAFAAGDQTVKQNYKFIDNEKLGKPNREALGFVWNNVAPGSGALDRARQMVRMIRRPGNLTAEMIEARCERGAVILHKLGLSVDTSAAVYSLDEHWNGRGLPDHLAGQQIPLLGRICAVAQHLDLFATEFGTRRALDTLRERSGAWFDPELVQAVEALDREGTLWSLCLPEEDTTAARAAVVLLDPGSATALAAREIDLICSGFADVVDAKSPFMYRHSVGTTEVAVLMGQFVGLPPARVDLLRRASLLHDIGALSLPNTLLDKPGPLSALEWAAVHRHPSLSREILSRVGAFAELAELAEQHHERLDGSGYPLGLSAAQLSMEARILATADVFSALLESRAYREDLTPARIQRELARSMPHQLDPACVEAALAVLDQLGGLPLEEVPAMSAGLAPELVLQDPPPFRF